jgi:hypothetical protein
MQNESNKFNEQNFVDLHGKTFVGRRVSNTSLRDGLEPMSDEVIQKITETFHKHRAYMDKKYGDDPKYFMFTRRNKNSSQENNNNIKNIPSENQLSTKVCFMFVFNH